MVELIKLEIEGFGKFDKKKIIKFDKGVNFINGLNEAGKSTILEAILASLFNYTKLNIKPFFCWKNKDVCKLVLDYKTDDGELFQIVSDYKNEKKKLIKIQKSGNSEISTKFKIINKFINEHFGFNDQKVFENTTIIKQSQMAILGDSPTKNKLRDMIEEVLVGSAEASATKALKKINKVSKDSKKMAESLNDELFDLKEKLKESEEHRDSLNKDSGKEEEISKLFSEKKKKLSELKERKQKFDKKESYQTDANLLNKDINNIDKTLHNIENSIEERDKVLDKLDKYSNFDQISENDFSNIENKVKKLDGFKIEIKMLEKNNKKIVIPESFNITYIILFIIGLIFSLILIGIPLAIYSYRRIKTEAESYESNDSVEEINSIKRKEIKIIEELGEITKDIDNFDQDYNKFIELFRNYSKETDKIENISESIRNFIKNVLDKNEITNKEKEDKRKIEEIKTELINKLTMVNNNLDKYKLVNITDREINEIDSLENETQKLNNQQIELKTSVSKTKQLIKSPEEIQEKYDSVEGKIKELNEKSEENDIAFKFLEKAETEVQNKFTPVIRKNSKEILNKVTCGKYSELNIDEKDLNITVKAPEINEFVPVDILSQGAKDQIYFALRTTMTDLLGSNLNIPLILDDPFHNFDDIRLGKTISAVKELSDNKQIILISHKPYQKKYKNFVDNLIEVK